MENLQTKIGLEIHVQLATKSKMFCRCNNNAEQVTPNTLVCPVCLGLPGALPVANRTAIEWTIKTGLALNCDIPEVAKFDRKHYFYPDLPKGYQISQYDEPFCKGGWLEIDGKKVRLNRIHLEEDAGKLIHRGNQSLVDLNRAGTPLMEIVTEPDITSPRMAGDFLRHLQKIVRDVVEVSEASMEKGHLRCDANISVSETSHSAKASRDLGLEPRMSQIIEIKNLNSFRFVEKALAKAEEKLSDEYQSWPEKLSKETWGYNSETDAIFLQRTKEEAADYRYFPEPDLPPIKSAEFDLNKLRSDAKADEFENVATLVADGVAESDAKVLVSNQTKMKFYQSVASALTEDNSHSFLAKAIIQKYFPFEIDSSDIGRADLYSWAILLLKNRQINKIKFGELTQQIHFGDQIDKNMVVTIHASEDAVRLIIDKVLADNPTEVERYKKGETKLIGFFIGTIMKETKGSADPQLINRILKSILNNCS